MDNIIRKASGIGRFPFGGDDKGPALPVQAAGSLRPARPDAEHVPSPRSERAKRVRSQDAEAGNRPAPRRRVGTAPADLPAAARAPITLAPLEAALEQLRSFQESDLVRPAQDRRAESLALGRRIGLDRMPPRDQDRLLAARVDRLRELASARPSPSATADPILSGLLQ